jgi:GrpB-like predicted nucleotidyltransferase (UPF0157 family)
MVADRPLIGPYEDAPAQCHEYDPRAPEVAAWLAEWVRAALPGVAIEHVGSTAVPNCDGKGIVDLLVVYPDGRLEAVKAALGELGYQPQTSGNPFPEERPMRTGTVMYKGTRYRIHVHVIRDGMPEAEALVRFRDKLRADPALLREYVARKRTIIGSGIVVTGDYSNAKGDFIRKASSD